METFIRKAINNSTAKIVQFICTSINRIDYCVLFVVLLGYLGISKHKNNDTLNSLFISMIASGIFYFFSIYFPKLLYMRRMKKSLSELLPQFDKASEIIINKIPKDKASKYKYDDFILFAKSKDKKNSTLEKAKASFILYYFVETDILIQVMECQCKIMINLYTRYSNILRVDAEEKINKYCDFCTLALSLSEKDKKKYIAALFEALIESIKISSFIKTVYLID